MKISLTFCVLIAVGVLFAVAAIGVSSPAGIPDSELSLSKTSVFQVANPDPVVNNTSEPGDRPTVHRTYIGTPPSIPHGIVEFVPILLTENQCLDCHLVEEAIEGEPTPVPESHFIDIRNAPGKVQNAVAGARYNCVTCHVPLTEAEPLVDNHFEP